MHVPAQVDSGGIGGQQDMLTELDQITLANMTTAIDAVCDKLPADKDTHENRKRFADAMIDYERSGSRSLCDFRSLGSKTLEEITRPK